MIIGFAGPKRSGKDYACSIVKSYFPFVERIAFADPIKHKICEIFGFTLEELEELKTKHGLYICSSNKDNEIEYYGDFSGRRILTGIGMLMRNCNEHQFEDYVRDIVKNTKDPKLFICTDVRFQSEVNLIHELGGAVIQIHREGVEYEMSETERGIKDYDYLIENDFYFEKNIIELIGRILINKIKEK